jgi:hypothetical protein
VHSFGVTCSTVLSSVVSCNVVYCVRKTPCHTSKKRCDGSKFFDALCVTIPSHACKVVPEHVHMHVFSLSMQGAQNTMSYTQHSFICVTYTNIPTSLNSRAHPIPTHIPRFTNSRTAFLMLTKATLHCRFCVCVLCNERREKLINAIRTINLHPPTH